MLEASSPCFVQTNFSFNILAAKNLQTSVNDFNESPANTPGLHSCEVRTRPAEGRRFPRVAAEWGWVSVKP